MDTNDALGCSVHFLLEERTESYLSTAKGALAEKKCAERQELPQADSSAGWQAGEVRYL